MRGRAPAEMEGKQMTKSDAQHPMIPLGVL